MSKRKRLAVVSWRHRARHDEDLSLSRWLFLIWHWGRVPLLCVKSSGWGSWLMARPAKPVLANRGRADTQLRRVCAGHPISAFRRLCRWGANEHLICVTESKPRFRPSYFCQPSYFWVLVFTGLVPSYLSELLTTGVCATHQMGDGRRLGNFLLPFHRSRTTFETFQ